MRNYLFSLDGRSSDLLDQIQAELGCSRSAAVRMSIRFYQNMNQINIRASGDLYKNLPDLPFEQESIDD